MYNLEVLFVLSGLGQCRKKFLLVLFSIFGLNRKGKITIIIFY